MAGLLEDGYIQSVLETSKYKIYSPLVLFLQCLQWIKKYQKIFIKNSILTPKFIKIRNNDKK